MMTGTVRIGWVGTVAAGMLISLGPAVVAPAATTFEGENGRIAWSRDGDVFTMRADGSGKRQLTQNRRYEQAQWSPDGRWLAVAQSPATPDQRMRVLVMTARGEDRRVVARVRHSLQGMAWSPDGDQLVFCDLDLSQPDEPAPYPSAIKLVDVASATVTRLTAYSDRACGPTWSPDGTRIAYVAGDEQDTDIYVMDADGSDTSSVVQDDSTKQLEVAWSPTADLLAFTSWEPSGQGSGAVEVVAADGTERRELTRSPEGSADHLPAWSPDGTRLLFFRLQVEPWSASLRVIDSNGADQMAISGVELGHASWSPDSELVAFGRKGNILSRPLDGTTDVLAAGRTTFDAAPDWQSR